MDDEIKAQFSFYVGLVGSCLFVISEILSFSKCKSNGVIQFVLNGICIEIRYHNVEEIIAHAFSSISGNSTSSDKSIGSGDSTSSLLVNEDDQDSDADTLVD